MRFCQPRNLPARTTPPAELVDYIAQSGDTLPALANRLNTSVREIREANPIIPEYATTMPPGMPMKIPIYYAPLWGSPFKIIPDSLCERSAPVGFDTANTLPIKRLAEKLRFREWSDPRWGRDGGLCRPNYSVSPRLLLAVLEYQSGALTQPGPGKWAETTACVDHFGTVKARTSSSSWAANLNNGYYRLSQRRHLHRLP